MNTTNYELVSSKMTRMNLRAVALPLLAAFGSLLFGNCAAFAQGGDPVTTVEVPASAWVWRDAIATAPVTVQCVDSTGAAVTGAPVTFSVTSPGLIASDGPYTTDASGNATAQVSSVDFTTLGTDATATLTASTTDGNVQGTVPVDLDGALEVLLQSYDTNGNPITTNVAGQTTACYVGEQQAVTACDASGYALPPSGPGSTWQTDGNCAPIKSWTPSDPSNTGASLTTYLMAADIDAPGVAPYFTTKGATTWAYNENLPNGKGGSASASFNVAEPATTFTATQNAIAALGGAVADGIGALNGDTTKPGIFFYGAVSAPGGTVKYAQFLSVFNKQVNFGAITDVCTNIPGLDTGYPYGSGPQTQDSPACKGGPGITTANSGRFTGTMYLIWQSSRPASIDIPVESIDWNWDADAFWDGEGILTSLEGDPMLDGAPNGKVGAAYESGILSWSQTAEAIP